MSKIADTLKYSNELEAKLSTKLFLGGSVPTEEDVKAFNKLIGGEENVALARWIKNMASYTPSERAGWGAPVTVVAPTLKEATA